MKSTSEYLEILKQFKEANAEKYGIKRLGIFGSVARGEQKEGSDVDVCVEINTPNLFTLVHIKDELQKIFSCNVDIVRLRNNMDSLLKSCINKEGLYV